MRKVIVDTPDTLIVRCARAKPHLLSLLKDIYVEYGDKGDWEALQELHYKGHSLAAGSQFMRCVYDNGIEKQTIGVLVFANPMPLNSGRNVVFPMLKPNQGGRDSKIVNQRRMQQINRYLAWNNRTVLDTMFRSAGIAYRFKNLAYRMYCNKSGKRYVESNSSMGKFNPFSIKTGMSFIRPKPANALDVGIDFFKHNFVSHPCDQSALLSELQAMPEGVRKVYEQKLREFYQRNSAMEKSGDKMHSGMSRINKLDISYVLRQTVQIVFGATVYWTWKNPDVTEKLPHRLPLLAFDRQGPNDPFVMDENDELR